MESNRRRHIVVALPEGTTAEQVQRLTRALELYLLPAADGIQLDDARLPVELVDVPGDALEDALNRPELHPTADPSGTFAVRPKGGRQEDWAGLVRQLADGSWEAEVRVDGRPDGMASEVLAGTPLNRRAAARLVMAAWNDGR